MSGISLLNHEKSDGDSKNYYSRMNFSFIFPPCHKDLDQVVQVLLHKGAESNAFLREVVEKCLAAMVTSVSPQKALLALISGGLA